MNDPYLIKHELCAQGLPVYEGDIPYIDNILTTINQSQASLQAFPDVNNEKPITVVDRRLML